jgi:murein DD-endopeptidase MepM/ murein hydrolase activator NlpD
VLPAVLLAVITAAVGALSLLPSRDVSPTPAFLAVPQASPALVLRGDVGNLVVRARPPVRRVTPAAKPIPARPLRASRSKAIAVPRGYVCPVRGRYSFVDTWGDPRPGGRRHKGNDVMAPYGEPVVAVISGVIQTNYSANGGISLYLRGIDGNEYFYAHNSRNVAVTGQHVSTGEVIGYVGNTGDARGGPTHVHFEVHPGGGAPVDPYAFLRRACS